MPIVNGGPPLLIDFTLLPPASSGGPRLTSQPDSLHDQLEDPVQGLCHFVDTTIVVDQVLSDFYGRMA